MRFFISYRRADSLHESHMLEKMLLRLNSAQYPIEVFIDTEKIKLGQDFEKKMIKELEDSDVVLAIIGQNWLNAVTENDDGSRRIDRQDDPVRLELERAIEKKIPLVTVLLDNAAQPSKIDLPVSLSKLTTAPCFQLSTEFDEFQRGVGKLVMFLQNFPSRHPSKSLQKGQLCFRNKAPGWPGGSSVINVVVNGKKFGEIVDNESTYKFSLEPDTYTIQLRRGLLYRSNKLAVNIRSGSSTNIPYVFSTFGGIEIELEK